MLTDGCQEGFQTVWPSEFSDSSIFGTSFIPALGNEQPNSNKQLFGSDSLRERRASHNSTSGGRVHVSSSLFQNQLILVD
jgi:hypothetical protein